MEEISKQEGVRTRIAEVQLTRHPRSWTDSTIPETDFSLAASDIITTMKPRLGQVHRLRRIARELFAPHLVVLYGRDELDDYVEDFGLNHTAQERIHFAPFESDRHIEQTFRRILTNRAG